MTKDVYINGEKIGFRVSNGGLYLLRCPKCDRENYAMCVSEGVCAWCGWKEESQNERR